MFLNLVKVLRWNNVSLPTSFCPKNPPQTVSLNTENIFMVYAYSYHNPYFLTQGFGGKHSKGPPQAT